MIMVAKFKKKIFKNEKGQALFEFIFFLPFMLIFYTMIIHIAGAINGSINQQKSLRGIFFGRLKGNITTPPERLAKSVAEETGANFFGMYSLIYSVRSEGRAAVAACYNIPLFGTPDPEECDEAQDREDISSPNVHVKTGFGICGMSYRNDPVSGYEREYG